MGEENTIYCMNSRGESLGLGLLFLVARNHSENLSKQKLELFYLSIFETFTLLLFLLLFPHLQFLLYLFVVLLYFIY